MSCNVKEGEQRINLKLVDVGLQTHMCPDLCQPIITSKNCNSNINNTRQCNNLISTYDSDKISNNPCQLDFKKTYNCVNPSDDYSCSIESKNTTKCFGFFCDKENLQCQLNEMKLLFEKKENAARKELCDTKQTYYNNEIIISKCLDDTKEQCQNKLDEANAQLETYKTAILYKEYELKNSQIREHHYKMTLEKLNETIKIKDKKIESEQKQILFTRNSMKDNEDQLLNLQKTELEKFNGHKSDQNLQLLKDDYNVQHGKDSEIDNKLEKPQTFIKKQQFSNKQNVKNNHCALKMSKTATKMKSKKYGPKLNLPCCIGSKNPCDRQKTVNLSQMNQLTSEYGVSRNNLETSEILRGPGE